ncbi:MAG: NAD(P)H-dependent glycerol-3-phosphate dehydrogenase, partial [Planctomycetota bacterium]
MASGATQVGILGTGQMAVMLATLLADTGRSPIMLGRAAAITHIRATGESSHLPGRPIPKAVRVTDEPASIADVDTLFVAVPTQSVRGVLEGLDVEPATVVSCAKGLELASGLRPSEVIAEVLPGGPEVMVLSGPNIAEEVAAKKPAGAVMAACDDEVARPICDLLTTPYFRIYTNCDVVGVELAGASKNIIALAAGIIDGLQLGNNAKASLITRGLVEITRLGTELGAAAETFAGLAGMGDLITTCVSPHGRNRSVGERIGRGEKLDDILADLGSVCEGVPTTRAVLQVAGERRIDMPIAQAVAAVLFEGRNVREVLTD